MIGFIFLFAAAEVFDPVKQVTQNGVDTRSAMTAISIGVAVGLLLFIWAYFRYRKKDTVPGTSVHSKPEPVEPASEGGEPERRRRRKRRRRRDHRPRNPSLQQTGGLPPQRPDDQLPKY